MKKMNKKGFTIVELVIVIAVIAILAGVMIPTFSGLVEKANDSKRVQLASAAYREAYAIALASGGEIIANEKADSNGLYFTFEADGLNATVVFATKDEDKTLGGEQVLADSAFEGYTITVAGGAVTVTEK